MNEYNINEIFKNILNDDNKGIKYIANNLNISNGTVKRWIELNKIPTSYNFEILKLSGIDINYDKFSYNDKDQFFTSNKTAKYCLKKVNNILKKYNDDNVNYIYIEPSVGSGSFYNILPNNSIGIDIEPQIFNNNNNNSKIIKKDYIDWKPDNNNNKYIVIGNPPFGLRGQLALKFINHSALFADYVCFILPQLFESDGKGVPRKRVKGLNLIHSEKLIDEYSIFNYPNGKTLKINCIFQIWSKNHSNEIYKIIKINEDKLKIYSLSDGGTPSTTRNKKMFNKCDIYIPSTCFGKHNMKYYNNFDDLPGRKGYGIVFYINKQENLEKFREIEWSEKAFLSTNSAYNIRSSQIAALFN